VSIATTPELIELRIHRAVSLWCATPCYRRASGVA
jgi:hypothetical protein